ncbi:SdpI family protein [Fictibacillus sp. WQ 8-8]|uniref:SdpI family protein n=1 Tax=Fictibacillus sp. WQ 8-8 TaxID=2938788 RepID=UPI00210E74F7|nr:SdpI family protein [Fictibacillus sp. WQ 8-8]MCQ6264803.1 SdpI family protein [Fictibacillus sp. WQ 8-8]
MMANLLFSLLIGVIFVLAGLFMKVKPPAKINPLYGYRTFRSMKNEKLWNEANTYCAGLMIKYGVAMAVFGVVFSLLIKNELAGVFATMGVMLLFIVLLFVKVEKRLKEIGQ